MKTLHIFAALWFCLTANHLQASNPSAPLRTIEFTTYGQYPIKDTWYQPICKEALTDGTPPSAPVKIETHSLTRKGPHTFTGDNTIRFYNPTTQRQVARVELPKKSDKWLLIFLKNPNYTTHPDTQLKYIIYPFDDSEKNLPIHSLVLLNLTGRELTGKIGKKRIQLNHGTSPKFKARKSIQINLWMRAKNGHDQLQALSKTYPFKAGNRNLILLFPPVLKGSADLDTRLLVERPLLAVLLPMPCPKNP